MCDVGRKNSNSKKSNSKSKKYSAILGDRPSKKFIKNVGKSK
jgi:hypothetical protein